MLTAVQGGHQGALMAPTEVLAEQHATGVRRMLEGVTVPDPGNLFGDRPLRVELLTNRVTGGDRRDVLAGLADGTVDIAIGTHALIQEGVQFHSLGVVVVDEQHRFGVEQRAALRSKGDDDAVPDVLVMTATPIPRTAAMTVYGDLDVSVLDELPPGRTPIVTHWADGPLMEQAAWATVRDEVAAGRQAYVVCPLIEESEKLEVASAQETFDRLVAGELKGLRLGSVARPPAVVGEGGGDGHGSVTAQLDVLVATTVIEVGVDVPNATVMVILDADRFGIAQLHQLRGRVGRGDARVDVLAGDRRDCRRRLPRGNPRVEALVASTDGFAAGRGRSRPPRRGHDHEHRPEGPQRPEAGVAAPRPRAGDAGPRRGVRDRRRRPDARRPSRAARRAAPAVQHRRRRVPLQVVKARHFETQS